MNRRDTISEQGYDVHRQIVNSWRKTLKKEKKNQENRSVQVGFLLQRWRWVPT